MVQDVINGTAVRPLELNVQEQQKLEGLRKNENPNQNKSQAKGFSPKVIEGASKEVNKALAGTNTRVEFSVYKQTNEIVVKIKDSETGKVIKQIPSKKDLEMAAYMRKLAGIIVDTTV